MNNVLTVSQLNRYLAFRFQEDSNLRGKLIQGELSNLSLGQASGHIFFTLKDSQAAVRGVMFREDAVRLGFSPQNGMHVVVSATVKVYQKDGLYQLVCTDMLPAGQGTVEVRQQQLKEKLAAEGLFELARKRKIPEFPHSIGIVTSPEGAALQDMLQILRRRYPLVRVQVFPTVVQGENAPKEIVKALNLAFSSACDVILLGRGGGSEEDLSAFQQETVVRAVAGAPMPVISAVGHETDVTLTDLVADLRAPTPSAAAELAVPDRKNLEETLKKYAEMLYNRMDSYVARLENRRMAEQVRFSALSVDTRLHFYKERFAALEVRAEQRIIGRIQAENVRLSQVEYALEMAVFRHLQNRNTQFERLSGALIALNPKDILSRGYALVYQNGELVKKSTGLIINSQLQIKFGDGSEVSAKVVSHSEAKND